MCEMFANISGSTVSIKRGSTVLWAAHRDTASLKSVQHMIQPDYYRDKLDLVMRL